MIPLGVAQMVSSPRRTEGMFVVLGRLQRREVIQSDLFINRCTYRSEDVDVLGAGDQMSVFGRARGRLELVSCQHPDLIGETNIRHKRVYLTPITDFIKQLVMNDFQSSAAVCGARISP